MDKKLRILLFGKMFIGFVIGFLIAWAFSLPYSYTAGVIVVLHLWYSRETVIASALKRLVASFVGLGVSALLFFLFGYQTYVIIIVVLIVLFILYTLKLEFGATIALVLIGQQWSEQTAHAPLNALYIMLIGTITALVLNAITYSNPKKLLPKIDNVVHLLETLFVDISKERTPDFEGTKESIKALQDYMQLVSENYRIENIIRLMDYINMRYNQLNLLEKVYNELCIVDSSIYKSYILEFIGKFENHIGEQDFASFLLVELNNLLEMYRALELPKTRLEFEHRARLYIVLDYLKAILNEKLIYHSKHQPI